MFLEPKNPERIKEQFCKELNKARLSAGLEKIGDNEAKKLQIACLSGSNPEKLEQRFAGLQRRLNEDRRYDAYWSFDTTAEVPIAFVGAQGTTAQDIWNLSLDESFAKRAEFDNLWNQVHDTTK